MLVGFDPLPTSNRCSALFISIPRLGKFEFESGILYNYVVTIVSIPILPAVGEMTFNLYVYIFVLCCISSSFIWIMFFNVAGCLTDKADIQHTIQKEHSLQYTNRGIVATIQAIRTRKIPEYVNYWTLFYHTSVLLSVIHCMYAMLFHTLCKY